MTQTAPIDSIRPMQANARRHGGRCDDKEDQRNNDSLRFHNAVPLMNPHRRSALLPKRDRPAKPHSAT